jgi:peroxiredoxin/uncharacterized membrane protein YphA (DoxX/SURF4 family)
MDGVALWASILLAVVFATAAASKFADQVGTRQALADFGMPSRSLKAFGVLLPLAEIAIAIALLFEPTARWAAIGALALLVVFMVAIARAMARGEAPDCHCFGQISSSPVGPRTLIRNAVIAVPAVFVVAYGPGESIDAWISARSAAELAAVAAGVAAIALAVAGLHLWRQNRHLRQDLARANEALGVFPPGLPVGAPAPRFSLPSIDGETTTLDDLIGRGRPVALVFVSPGCGPCVDMFGDLARWQSTLADRITIALLATGKKEQLREVIRDHRLSNVLVQKDSEVFHAYRAAATPSVVIVGADGNVASQTRSTQVLVETLVRRAVRDHAAASQQPSAVSNGAPFEVRRWSNVVGPTA